MIKKKKGKPMLEPDGKDLGLDFDDIMGEPKSISETKEKVEAKTESKVKTKPKVSKPPESKQKKEEPFILAIPNKDGGFFLKDVKKCTGEEFLAWAQWAHPCVTRYAEDFESVSNREKAFNQIVKWHRSGLNWLRSNEVPKKELFH